MTIRIVEGLAGAEKARGHVVVIDVLRAFTTAAFAFDAGIGEVELVRSPEEALARPGWRMGEVDGRLIPGFDHDNSPSRLAGMTLSGRAVQRTGSGTRCAVAAAPGAASLWLGSLVVLGATARALRGLDPVTLVASGCPDEGEEDTACAEALADLLRGRTPKLPDVVKRVLASRAAARHRSGDPARPPEDLTCCVDVDRFPFAMRAETADGALVARPVAPPPA